MLVRFRNVTKSFGACDVLDEISFQIDPGQKLGLIGANGSGKTTLLRLIENPGSADGGQVERASTLRTGRLDQHYRPSSGTVLDEALISFSHLEDLERRLRDLEGRIEQDHDPRLLERYSGLQHEFEHQTGYTYRSRTEAALYGLGFRQDQLRQATASLSGGEKNRLALARLLLDEVDLLLLDEPTNHLDIRSIEWLERFLRNTEKAVLLVSHDRFFLDRIVDGILELEGGRLREYRGNYSGYLKQREEHRESQEKAWKKQRAWIERTEEYVRRNIAGQNTRQAQSRRTALSRTERVERPTEATGKVRFRFSGSSAPSPRHILGARDLSVGHDARCPLVSGISLEVRRGERWAITGPNGSGKTTLLATLSGRRKPLAGELAIHERACGYYDQEPVDPDPARTVLEELRRLDGNATDGDLRSFLAGFLFRGEAVYKQIQNLSGGEKSRLALATLIYDAPPLLSLDEPTNHLDIASRESLEAALAGYPGTLFFVTHDRRLVERVATHILYLESGRAEVFDSFARFEQRLSGETKVAGGGKDTPPQSGKTRSELSKNRKDRIEKDVRRVEAAIGETEREIGEIEAMFQTASPGLDWESTNRRHRELRETSDALYTELNRLLEISQLDI